MPGKARLDAPGTLHHEEKREIEKKLKTFFSEALIFLF